MEANTETSHRRSLKSRVRFRSIKMATGGTGEQVTRIMRAQNVLLIATIVCGLAFAAPGSAEDRVIDTQRSTLTVRVFKSGLFRAFADDHVIQAPLADGSLDDSATPHVQILIDARRMRVLDPGLSAKDRQEVQTRMLGSEVLDVNRFPWISFHSVVIHRLDAGGWLVRGELTLHGQIHAMRVNVFPENSHYKGSATLRQSDFGIVPISILGGTVKVKDEIRIDFDLVITERLAAASGQEFRVGKIVINQPPGRTSGLIGTGADGALPDAPRLSAR